MEARQFSLHRGIWSVNASMAAYVVGDVTIKFLGRTLPTNEIVFLRTWIVALALAVAIFFTRRTPRLTGKITRPMLLRFVFDCVNIVAFTTAVIHVGLAELYAILQTAPLLMTVIAAILFKEPVGWRRWTAVSVGFLGVLMVVKPNPNALDIWALIGLLAAAGAAFREVVTQKIDPSIPTIEVTFYTAIFVGLVIAPVGLVEHWTFPAREHLLLVTLQAVCWIAGTILLIQASRYAPMSIVASFRYTLLIWGGLAGYFVFGDIPDSLSLLGFALIVGAGLYTFHRETVRRRALASKAMTMN
ncbi:MAG: DMT family transporter [Pseudolabrys sp.]|nr:DMT family transporter [Pseudolabrys sp.]